MDAPDDIPGMLERAAAGDPEAWRTVVDRFSPRVFAFLRSYTRDPELAEEVVQSVFCTVARKLADYEEQGRFDAWLFRIALNRLRDEMRRRKKHARPMDADVLADVGPAARAEVRAGREEIEALRAAMEELPEQDRLVIDLRHHGGMGFQQMADLLKEPLGTLLARHHRALRKLREMLRRRLGEEENP
ncbi:MAG: RNA polymerase sigma factor [Phycisphaerales bacterium]